MPSIDANVTKWSSYNWENMGDEWSSSWGGTPALWYGTILPRIHSLVPADHILELAPGFGRCTQYLAPLCNRLTIVDVTEKCIEHCRKRFADLNHINYHVNDGTSLDMVSDGSVDFVFSWDSFVHVEGDAIRAYLDQLAGKLKRGGRGFIHHSNMGAYLDRESGKLTIENRHWRATGMSGLLFQQYCREAGLTCVSQELVNWGANVLSDCFSFFSLATRVSVQMPNVVENPDFMAEAKRASKLAKLYTLPGFDDTASASAAPPDHPLPPTAAIDATSGSTGLCRQQADRRTYKVSIIIPVFNNLEYTRQCLTALVDNTPGELYEVIIVDNASTDGTQAFLEKIGGDVRIISNEDNLGFAKACNQGAQAASGEYLVFLNNDTVPLKGWLTSLLDFVQKHDDAGVVGCKLLYPDNTVQHCGAAMRHDRKFFRHPYKYLPADHPLVNRDRKLDAVTAACFLTPSKIFNLVGQFDETYLNGCEDMDYCTKIRSAGYGVYCNSGAALYHLESKTPRPVNRDKENFSHYVAKWGTEQMKNEIEFYEEDGFWVRNGSDYYPAPDAEAKAMQLAAAVPGDYAVRMIKRTFPAGHWRKAPTSSALLPGAPKVLFICHNFPPHRYAGAQLYALKLAKTMKALGLADIEVLYPVYRPDFKEYAIRKSEFEGITVHELIKEKTETFGEERARHPIVAELFNSFLLDNHFDAVHIHSLGQLTAVPLEILKRHRKKVILTLHDTWFLCFYWFLTTKDQQQCTGPESVEKCTNCILKYSNVGFLADRAYETVHTFLEYREKYLREMFGAALHRYAPSSYLANTFNSFGFQGVEVAHLGMEPVMRLPKQPGGGVVFGYMGRISKRKGINILLDAFELIKTKFDCSIRIFGEFDDDRYRDEILGRIGNLPQVEYAGKYTPDQIPAILSLVDMLVAPSFWENFPLVVQEAFQHKVPVIASNTGGFPEVVESGRNGLLFTVGDEHDLADKMSFVCQNPDRIPAFAENITAPRTLDDDARMYSSLYVNGGQTAEETNIPAKQAATAKKVTVQFYVYKNVHWPMFESLYGYLSGRDDVKELVICIPNLPNLTNWGSTHQLAEKLLDLGARIVTDPRQARADVTFIADTIAGKVQGCGRIVNVGHGTISKGYYFTESVWTEREEWVDLLCVPGEYARQRLSPILRTSVAATGMPKLDPVFAGRHSRKALCASLGLDEGMKIIIYAPTFNMNLSSVFNFAQHFHRLDAPDRYILIKLHGSTNPSLVEQYRNLAARSRQIIFVDDSNIAPYIGGADIMISDVSSAFMEFMALDKPVILYDNPAAAVYHGYDPENIEYAWRDLGTRVDSFEQLQAALERIITDGDDKGVLRREYAAQLFADRSGHAAANVWQETLNTLQKPSREPLPFFSVVLYLEEDAQVLARTLIHNLQFYSVMPLELVLVAAAGSIPDQYLHTLRQYNEFVRFTLVEIAPGTREGEALNRGAVACTGDFICIVRDDIALFKNFDYLLYKTFSAHPEVSLLTGLTNLPTPELDSSRRLANEHGEPLEGLAYRFINRYAGTGMEPLPRHTPPPPLTVFRKGTVDLAGEDLFTAISAVIDQGSAGICLSLFYHCLEGSVRDTILRLWRVRHSLGYDDRSKLMGELTEHFACPDMSEILVRDAVRMPLPDVNVGRHIAKSLHTRYYDAEYKAWLGSILDESSPWRNILQTDTRIIAALTSAAPAHPAATRRKSGLRVLFYFFKNVHIPILIPIYRKMKELHPEAEIAFGYMHHAPEIRAGFIDEELQAIASFGEKMFAVPQEFRPDITFIADSVYPWVQGCGRLVHVGHGVLSKGQYYTDTEIARREENADLVCVPGSYHENVMKRIISRPIIATGMAKLDDLFSGRINRASVLDQFGLPGDFRYVLFAPTFNDELSAIPFVRDQINRVLPDNNTLLLVKLHGSTRNEYKEMYRNLVQDDPRVIFADELDITPFLALADVMISDVSSSMMEFAALDKPVILFDNPRWPDYKNFNPEDIEFRWRDIGIRVKSLEEMKEAVSRSLAAPGEFSEKRKFYSDQLFVNKYEGDAAGRIIAAAFQLIGRDCA